MSEPIAPARTVAEWLKASVDDALHSGSIPTRLEREQETARLLGEALGHLGSFVRGSGGRLHFFQHNSGRSIRVSVRAGSPFVLFALGLLDQLPTRSVVRAITLAVARAELATPWEQEKGSR